MLVIRKRPPPQANHQTTKIPPLIETTSSATNSFIVTGTTSDLDTASSISTGNYPTRPICYVQKVISNFEEIMKNWLNIQRYSYLSTKAAQTVGIYHLQFNLSVMILLAGF